MTTPSGSTLIKHEEIVEFKVIVAIDFGTHGTGLGYAINDEKNQEIYIEQDWGQTRKLVDSKNKTDILLTYNGKFLKFGDDALEEYLNQGDGESDTDSEDLEDDEKAERIARKHMLFESFKMALYESKEDGSGDIRRQIACVDGRLYSTDIVFIEALKYMKRKTMDTFKQKKIDCVESINDIQWILTVPAIWSDRAKYKMEYWAQKAELISKKIFNHLRIVYEPDCASISCQYEINENNNNTFGIGERYILIDAGGGTVDIAYHQVKGEYCIEELNHGTGGPWGSDYIDEHFDQLLIEIFDEDNVKEFQQQQPANYTRIKDSFRKTKMSFYNNNNDEKEDEFHGVQLSLEFIFAVADDKEEFNNIIDTCHPFGICTGCFKMEKDKLLIRSNIWKEYLFDRVIDPMISHVEQMIPKVNQTRDKEGNIKNIKYLCIAGGLAQSKYFRERIYESFGMKSKYKLSIRVPKRPILSVIDGALRLGLNPNYIKTRRLKYTYGIAVDRNEKNVDKNKLPKGYLKIKGNLYQRANAKQKTVRNLFSKWVTKNDSVDKGQPFIKQYRRLTKETNLSIYCSEKINPYVVEGKPLASVTVKFPDDYKEESFTVKFYFGDTKISAKVLYGSSKNNNQEKELGVPLELEYQK